MNIHPSYRDPQYGSFCIETARNGERTLCVIIEEGKKRYIESTHSPSADAARRVASVADNMHGDIFLLGCGLGYDIAQLQKTHTHQRLYVIERSPDVYAAYCAGMPSREARVEFILGDAREKLLEVLQGGVGPFSIIIHPETHFLYPEYYQQCVHDIQSYHKTDLSVTLLVGKGIVAPYILRDMADAFQAHGCQVEVLSLKAAEEGSIPERIRNSQYIVSLDGAGLFFPAIRSLSARRVAWFVDNPFYYIDSVDPELIVFSWDEAYVSELRTYGFRDVYTLPLATNPRIFNAEPLPSALSEQFLCEVSFVGSIGPAKEERMRERNAFFRHALSPDLHEQCERILRQKYEAFLSGKGSDYYSMYAKQYASIDRNARLMIDRYVDIEVGDMLRENVVHVMGQFEGKLYGSKSLKRLETKQCIYSGPIDYEKELPVVYKASIINVNVTRPQLVTALNQRIYDVSATRSFLLTDYRSSVRSLAPECYKEICYCSLKDLEDKIKYYSSHVSERKGIQDYLYQIVIKGHTYKHRIAEFLDIIKKK